MHGREEQHSLCAFVSRAAQLLQLVFHFRARARQCTSQFGSSCASAPQIVDLLGQAAFSRAVQALDLRTGALVCLKIIKVWVRGLQLHNVGPAVWQPEVSVHVSNTPRQQLLLHCG